MKTSKRICAAALALLLCLGLLPSPALGAGDTVEIATPHDLVELAGKCALDTWSEGKTVVLTADLDLTAVPFSPIPSFRGTFEGNGHTITGFHLTEKGSRQGLFRVVEAGGVVQNLTVEGVLMPGGSKSSLGLLAGENAGTIRACVGKGAVTGQSDVGGLVGLNSGTVERCEADITVTGVENTGGVCGRNTGVLTGCTSRGQVNTAPASESLTDPILNTGGVVGRSEGAVAGCENHAQVGYPHTGYNVGGVAGLHSGNLSGCSNYGEILGRKGVGGVAGRFLPDTDIVYGQDPVKALNSALSGLSGLLTTLSGQMSDTAGAGVDDLEAISGELDALRGAASAGREQGSGDARAALDSVYDRVQSINAGADAVNDSFRRFSDDANGQLDDLTEHMDQLRAGLDALADALDGGLGEAADQLEWYTGAIQSSVSAIRRAMDGLSSDLGKIDSFLNTAAAILQGDGGLLEKLSQLETAAQKLKGMDLGSHLKRMGSAIDAIGRELADLSKALNDAYGDASSDAQAARKKIDRAADGVSEDLRGLNTTFKTLSDQVSGQLKSINGDMDAIEDTLKNWADQIDTVGTATLDDIDAHLDAISGQIDKLTSGARSSNESIHTTTDAVIRQLEAVRLAANGLTESPEYTVDDRSDQESGEDGLVLSAQNLGEVTGDANVGGIVGIISIQLSDDPEDELDWDSDEAGVLADVTAVVRAAVRACENTGAVTAKNECAGGIVGRSDMGAVLDSLNTGDVTVESGSSCGGVAGLSRGIIRRSGALCLLTGEDGVGGIAGEGRDLSDCRAMVTLDAVGEKLGAIAGWADGELSGNYSVREGLGAVDGTDLAGRAQGLPYEEFSALEGLPEVFRRFVLTFRAEGQVVKEVPFSYGGSISAGDVPEVPKRDGCYAAWEEFSTAGLRRSRIIEAVYTPWESTISSGGNKPAMLAEGSFSPAAAIALGDWAPETAGRGKTLAASWSYAVTDSERAVEGTLRVRVLAETGGDKAVAALWRDGALVPVENAVRDGSYLVFDAPSSGQVAILAPAGAPAGLLAAAGGIAALAAALLIRKGRKGRKRRKTAEEETAAV